MKRLVAYVLGLGVLLAILLLPAASWNSGGDTTVDDGFTVSSYVADFAVADNGDLTVDETLVVDFIRSGKHGIFRFWDRADPSAATARRTPHDVSVTRDGQPEPFEMLAEDHGRVTVAKIGSAGTTLDTGEHTYAIHYVIDGVLEPGTGGARTQLYWNLVPDAPTIDSTDLTIHLPVAAQPGVRCAVGTGATDGCTVAGDGTDTLRVTTGSLAPHTPVTIKAGLDLATPPAGQSLPWPARFDRVLGTSLPLLVLVLLLAGAAAVLGAVVSRRSWEREPGFPLTYAPPEGIGPAQATYIFGETIDKEAYVATLMYAAEKGAIDLDKREGSWSITDKSGADGWAGLDPVTGGVAHLLGGPGTTFTAAPKDVEAGKRLNSEITSFEEDTRDWATREGHMATSGLGGLGSTVILVAFGAAVAVAIWNPVSMTALGLVPGLFAVFGASLMAPGSGTKRTKSGRDLWSRVGGFRRVLSTDSSKERFDFSGREDLYTAYIPWAVALGCADEWAAKYRTEMATEPPVPSYFGGAYAGAAAGSYVSSMVDDFSSTVDSAVSSYQATQSSSSSGGGGGFSGGGGGGGGGVGSW
ncbi:MAG: hypothetical protein JWN22_264 [Nocardioides sp.]|jgi:hypothetical protein|nr:hypothetical protein [Nocardioides sp.]